MTTPVSKFTLITPTSDRAVAFEFCERWMRRALTNFDGEVQWIVADDGHQPVSCSMNQLHLKSTPTADPVVSFRNNLLTALSHIKHDHILFIEDDDWYAADYLQQMAAWFTPGVKLVGENESSYYHIGSRRYLHCRNRQHASLCQTGIHCSLVEWVTKFLKRRETPYVDYELWFRFHAPDVSRLKSPSRLALGIKGFPGKTGIGVGHRLPKRARHDPHGKFLEQRIGKDDTARYFDLFNNRAA